MELYAATSYRLSRQLTLDYSTSFGSSVLQLAPSLRSHVFAVYGLVRIADEIVDTYRGDDAAVLLSDLEAEVYAAISRGFSVNPIVHSFALTAREFGVDASLVAPFFKSMAMDLSPQTYTQEKYEQYIYGSAEAVGLMCLRVFVAGDDDRYKKLEAGACALGSAYQKVNFLRDIAADFRELGRSYFPDITFDSFDDAAKLALIADIEHDVQRAKAAMQALPRGSRYAVELSLEYYGALLEKLKKTPAEVLKQKRVRVSNGAKAGLLVKSSLKKGLRRGA